jgi:uncharacterized membrane protein YczE
MPGLATFFERPTPDRLASRLVQLVLGLILYGASSALLVLGGLGLEPWNVFHQGLSRHTGIAIGTWAILASAGVLLLWIPLRQRPGVGTIANAILVGAVMDLVLWLAAAPHSLPARTACMVSGVILNGIATGAYIGAGLGPGPRDGLMLGISRRTGISIRVARWSVEAAVLAIGWALGGTLGLGTLLYALCIGPLAHFFVPFFDRTSEPT